MPIHIVNSGGKSLSLDSVEIIEEHEDTPSDSIKLDSDLASPNVKMVSMQDRTYNSIVETKQETELAENLLSAIYFRILKRTKEKHNSKYEGIEQNGQMVPLITSKEMNKYTDLFDCRNILIPYDYQFRESTEKIYNTQMEFTILENKT